MRETQAIHRKEWAVSSWILVLSCALGVTPAGIGQELRQPLGTSGVRHAAQNRAATRTGVAIFQGRALEYEVVDGWAVHGGDMILGTVEEVEAEFRSTHKAKTGVAPWPERRSIAAVDPEHLWPDGIIPYVIGPGFNERGLANIRDAVEEWNTKTVITLVERTTELDFVRFRPQGWTCLASVGRIGGEQSIWLGGPDACDVAATIHEIGHAVGLHHEHQRTDRDVHVSIGDFEAYGAIGPFYRAAFQGGSPYDYASVMHYTVIADSVPPGIPIRAAREIGGLSPGDIDGVARLYGKAPTATTISTNPQGLEIIVDGEPVTTPATFNWSLGSEHVLEASSPQTVPGQRFLFGRWNDGGPRRHVVTAGADNTWIEANYIVQQRLVACADPAESGDVRIRPDADDGYYTIRVPVEIEATPSVGSSRAFMNWHSTGGLSVRADRRSGRSSPGQSSNPTFGLASQSFAQGGEHSAVFAAKPLFRIESNVQGISIRLDDGSKRLPWAFPADEYPDGISLEAPATVPDETVRATEVRYRFNGWSDGGERAHSVAVPEGGGSVSLNLTREYRLRISENSRRDDGLAVSVSPLSEDGFYAAGTQVRLTASPDSGEHFAGWTGEVSGFEPVQTVVMDAPKSVAAVFATSGPLGPNEEKDVVLAASRHHRVYGQSVGWNVLVPPDATELTVRFQSASGGEVDLYVRRRQEIYWETQDDGQAPRIHAEFRSTTPGANETITVRRDSIPRLTNDVYFIALGVPPTARQIRGTLSVAIRRSGIVKAWPPAFTFVASNGSDPAPQVLRLAHETAGSVRYRIEPNRPWVSVSPSEWVQTGSGSTEIAVAVNAAGLLSGMHEGDVTVVQVQGQNAGSAGTSTGIKLPLAFTVLPSSRSVGRRVNAARITSRPQAGDTYGAGETVEVSVDVVDPVMTTGSPTLALGIGSLTRSVEWDGVNHARRCGLGAGRLTFRYVVQTEDRDADGISVAENALALNGGSIETAQGRLAVLALAPIVNNPEHKVDGSKLSAPEVRGVWIRSSPQDGESYGVGEEIWGQVGFSQEVEMEGSPVLALTVGASTRAISLTSGGDRYLWFRYRVQAGDSDADGVSILAGALALNGGSIRGAAGADARLDLGEYAIVNDPEHKVDGSKLSAPEVRRVLVQSRPQDGTSYGVGEQIWGFVEFSQEVEMEGSPTLALTVAASTQVISLTSGGGQYLRFSYRVQAGDADADGVSILAGALALNGGSIRSAAGADARLDLGEYAIVNDPEHKVDGSKVSAPQVASLAIGSSPQDGTSYGVGEEILGSVSFSQGVQVTGSPTLALMVGTTIRAISLTWGGNRFLGFRYRVRAEDADADGVSILAGALALNGGSIRSAAGLDAALDLGEHAIVNHPAHKVDGSKAAAPVVSDVRITSRPQDGTSYGAGEEIRGLVELTQVVVMTGSPTLALMVGTSTRAVSLTLRGGRHLGFRYRVRPGDADGDGVSILADALALNGGSIRSVAGPDAALGLGSHAIVDDPEHKVGGG